MLSLIAALFSNPARVAGGVGALVVLLAVGYQEVRVLDRDHQLSVASARTSDQDRVIGQLKQNVGQDEAALKQYAELAAQAKAAQDAANARAAVAAAQAAKAEAALAMMPVPKDCAGATKWGADVAHDLMKGW